MGLREVVSEARQSVFAVILERASPQPGEQKVQVLGTGFFVSGDGYFVTADHVVNPDHNVAAGRARGPTDNIAIAQIHPDGRSASLVSPMTVVVQNQPKDFAILRTPDNVRNVQKYLELDTRSRFEGEEVAICGYPMASSNQDPKSGAISLNLSIRVSGGILSCQRIDGGLSILEVDFPILPGNSGGPLLATDSGKVLGLAKGTITVGQQGGHPLGMFGVCVDVRELKVEFKKIGVL